MRPGRLELKLLIGPPDCKGREEILTIHTRAMAESGRLVLSGGGGGGDSDTALGRLRSGLAESTEGWSGAELAGLARASVSRAIERDAVDPRVEPADFWAALDDADVRAPSRKRRWKKKLGF